MASTAPKLKVGRKVCGDYEVVKVLGQGSYGEVALVTSLRSGDSVAAKRTLRVIPTMSGNIPETDFYIEVDLLMRFNHPNLLRARDYYLSETEGCAILEVAEGDLDGYIKQRRGKGVAKPTMDVYLGCCRGLAYLHSQGVIHRDIKPPNILLVNGVPKIADFGASVTTQGPIPFTREIVTSWWRPPELFCLPTDGKYAYSYEIDVWSMLVIGIELLFHQEPLGKGWAHLTKWKPTLINAIRASGAYVPPEFLSQATGNFTPLIDTIVATIYPDLREPAFAHTADFAEWMSDAIAAAPAARPTAEDLYESFFLYYSLVVPRAGPKPNEAINTYPARIAYGGDFTPESRTKYLDRAESLVSPKIFLSVADIFDRLSTQMNSGIEEIRANLVCAVFLASAIFGEDLADLMMRHPGISSHLKRALEILEFRIYRPDMTVTIGLDLDSAVAIARGNLTPEEITV